MKLTQCLEFSPELALIEMSGKRGARPSGAIHQTQDDPKHEEDEQSHGQREKAPSVEADGVRLRKIALPHSDQYEVDAGAGESAHPSDRRRVRHPQNHRLAELGLGVGPGPTRRKTLEDPGGDRHHHHRRRHVVHPHADEESGGADSQKEQWWVQWLPTEHKSYLRCIVWSRLLLILKFV